MSNRIIKFRGKSLHYGKWVYGDLLHTGRNMDDPCIAEGDGYCTESGYIHNETDIFPDTVGQFTGLLDKNGKEIYEGDIVRYYDDIEDELVHANVIYYADSCSFCVTPAYRDVVELCAHWQFEVIGNIHDNPELLKGGAI